MANVVTLETIRIQCGYQNYDAMRQSWYALFGKEGGFPEKDLPLSDNQAREYLQKISRPYPNKPPQVVQGALLLLEGLASGRMPEVKHEQIQPAEESPEKPRVSRPRIAAPNITPSPLDLTPEQLRVKIILEKEAEDKARRDEHYRSQAEAEKEQLAISQKLSPYIIGLTWTLNALEMLFLMLGFYLNADLMGLMAGVFIAVLGAIVLLQVQVTGSQAGGYAVVAWFIVCFIGGWLVEYPAMLQALTRNGSVISSDGETYSMISVEAYSILVTMLISGSSFAGTYLRYLKAQAQ